MTEDSNFQTQEASNFAPAQSAIEVLLDLAQRGEIDPWDVQVIEVIDRYLSKLGLAGESSGETEEANLPQSGQTFLWASMLVLLKAQTLQLLEEAEDEEEEFEEIGGDIGEGRALPLHLEQHIRRRAAAPPLRTRRVTLQELIEQIQEMVVVLESSPTTRPPRKVRPPSRKQAAKAIAGLAHNENLTEIATQLEELLQLRWSQLSLENNWVNLEQLVGWWTETGVASELLAHSEKSNRVGVFWALLLLSAQSKVELSQEEFYQDIQIRVLESTDSKMEK